MAIISFTHVWIDKFGWRETLFNSNDFVSVEFLAKTKEGHDVYLCLQDNGFKRFCSINN